MFLKSLELSGFKSFAKRTVLQFEPGITAVVGPNGSGKSNIADAIRWVMGAQSKKAVRGKVSTDVIFSGSGTKAAMGLAEVSLTFDNADHLLPYDYDEVVITRRLYRSGDSEYLVNGAKVRLTDLQHSLAVAGIGAETYTVIGQGMVDRVLSQTPAQRRTMFEEAAGVRQFYIKRDEARRKLSETSTNLSRVEDILKELEPRLKSLRRQASVLARREEIEGQLKDAYLARYGHRFREVHGAFETATHKRDDLNREFIAITEELSALTKEITDLRKRQQGMKLNELLRRESELRERQAGLQTELGKSTTAREVAVSSREQLRASREQLADRLAELKQHAPEAAPEGSGLAGDIKTAQAAFDALEADYQKLKEQLSAGAGSGKALDAAATEFEGLLTELETAVAEQRSHADLAAILKRLRTAAKSFSNLAGVSGSLDEAKALLSKRDEAHQKLQDLKLKQATEQEAIRLREEQTERYTRERKAVEEQLAQVEADEAARSRTVTAESARTDELTEQLAEIDKELSLLGKEIEAEQAQGTGNPEELTEKETVLDAKRKTHDAYQADLNALNVELAKLETRLEDLHGEARTKLGDTFPPKAEDQLPEAEQGSDTNIAKLERKMLELGGIDPEVTKEHQEVEERFTFLSTQGEDLRKAKGDLERVIRQLEQKSRTIFRDSFEKINEQFSEYFKQLFGGGKATLTLVEPKPEEGEEAAPADFGIDIAATPPGKKMQSLAMLSGGERAMTSVALLFAILTVNPSPFVMLDEVDAALDEANTGRFADTLAALGEQTQFIVVTHNRDSMRAAEMLYGVTMDETGISTLLSLKLPEAEKVAQGA